MKILKWVKEESADGKNNLVVLAASILFVAVIFALAWSGKSNADARRAQFAQTETVAEMDLKIRGNRSSKIYHLPNCPNYNDIADRNVVNFKTIDEAVQAGFRMARNCK